MTAPAKRPLCEVEAAFGRIWAFEDDHITREVIVFGAYARFGLALVRSVVHEGDAVFDIGAHIGTFTLPLALKAGSRGHVVAVEGNAETFAVLERNVAQMRTAAAVTCINAIMAPRGGRYALTIPEGNTGAAFYVAAADDEVASIATTTSLDELRGLFGAPRVIKMDIEGWEAWTLANYATMSADRPIIYVEVSEAYLPHAGASMPELNCILRDGGYRFYAIARPDPGEHFEFGCTALEAFEDRRPLF
jgi:FkbM family methyltransferase